LAPSPTIIAEGGGHERVIAPYAAWGSGRVSKAGPALQTSFFGFEHSVLDSFNVFKCSMNSSFIAASLLLSFRKSIFVWGRGVDPEPEV
jgi:hypothetical protein